MEAVDSHRGQSKPRHIYKKEHASDLLGGNCLPLLGRPSWICQSLYSGLVCRLSLLISVVKFVAAMGLGSDLSDSAAACKLPSP